MSKLRIAVWGAGHWGPNLIRNFHENPDSTVTWVCDLDPQRLKLVAERYPGVKTSADWTQSLRAADVDAVVICTPASVHYQMAKAAILAGKDLLVEKPLTAVASEARELVQLAREKNVKLMVGHVFLFNPAVQYIRELLVNNGLGDLYYLYSIRTNLGPIRADVNALWDLAAHDISMLSYFLNREPVSLLARGASFINPPVEDVVFVNFRYHPGIVANLHVSWLDPKKVRQWVIVGSQKMLVFDDLNSAEPIKIFDKNVGPTLSPAMLADSITTFRKSIFEGQSTTPALPAKEPLREEVQAFLDWVIRDVPQPATGEFGLSVVSLLETVQNELRAEAARVPAPLKSVSAPTPEAHA